MSLRIVGKSISLGAVAVSLSACLAASSGTGPENSPSAPVPENTPTEPPNDQTDLVTPPAPAAPAPSFQFSDTAGVFDLTFAALDTSPNSLTSTTMTGTVNLETQEITITDGTSSWTFPVAAGDPPTGPGEYLAVFSRDIDSDVDTSREFVVFLEDEGGIRSTRGFLGSATPTDMMPTTGTAVLSGSAEVSLSQAGSVQIGNGTAEMSIDFANSSADLAMTDFEGLFGAEAPPDVTISGLTIDGTGLTGGTVEGDAVAAVGANADYTFVGQFFGTNDDETGPDNAAGLFELNGDGGGLSGEFSVN